MTLIEKRRSTGALQNLAAQRGFAKRSIVECSVGVKPFRKPRASQFLRHKHAVGVEDVAPEGAAGFEAELRVERPRRHEGVPCSGFQTQSPIAAPPGFADDVFKKSGSDALAQMSGGRSHGFDLCVLWVQFLERSATGQRLAVPHTPECDVRLAQ